ncbi:MAG: hypothetical protein GC137_08805 [Alphaproteobacteria bacterium]|nr:hypothetical protein [Alphaproteobacteria bacterium]
MTDISAFSEEDKDAIISLPYRVGLHVSYAEDEDGEVDDELEIGSIVAVLEHIASNYKGLDQQIAQAALNHKEKWESWGQGVFVIEPKCEKAVLAIKKYASESEVKSYIKMVIEVATAVAEAYGEFGQGAEKKEGFANFIGNIFGGFSKSDANHPMNVSAAEDTAISSISAALKKNLK